MVGLMCICWTLPILLPPLSPRGAFLAAGRPFRTGWLNWFETVLVIFQIALMALPVAAVVMVLLRYAYHRYRGSQLYNRSRSGALSQDQSQGDGST